MGSFNLKIHQNSFLAAAGTYDAPPPFGASLLDAFSVSIRAKPASVPLAFLF